MRRPLAAVSSGLQLRYHNSAPPELVCNFCSVADFDCRFQTRHAIQRGFTGGSHNLFVLVPPFQKYKSTSHLYLAQGTEVQLICTCAKLFVPALATGILFCTCARYRFICTLVQIICTLVQIICTLVRFRAPLCS